MHDHRDDPDDEDLRPSRGKLRRAQHARDDALWKLAKLLTAMSPHARDKLPLPDELREEIALAASIAPSSGQRRQLRRVTQLLREGDAAAIERALKPTPTSSRAATPADGWIERLVREGDAGLQALVQAHEAVDRTRVRQWMRSVSAARARAEAAAQAGEPTPPKDKAERALRKYLTQLLG